MAQLADLSLQDFVASIGADRPSPGAGAAGAAALAMAAACLAKALVISARHCEDAGLAEATDRARELSALALAGAQLDADDFRALLKARYKAPAEARLRQDGEAMLDLAADLRGLLASVEPRIVGSMTGDVVAAKALIAAFNTIQRRNLAEQA